MKCSPRPLIAVRLQPVVEVDRQFGWGLVFYAGEPFDFAAPFRAILAEMVNALGQYAEANLQLPAYEQGVDFVDGHLRFGTHALGVYFEHSLGYILLHGPDRAPLDEAWAILSGMVIVNEQSPGLVRQTTNAPSDRPNPLTF